jgi:hypothetical protein
MTNKKTLEYQPYLLAHWQVARATLRPKLAKELTNASPSNRL